MPMRKIMGEVEEERVWEDRWRGRLRC